MSRDVLVLGGLSGPVYQPDAVEDWSASVEGGQGLRCQLMTKAYSPFGQNTEVVFRRLIVTGYHRTQVGFWITPLVEGRFRTELRSWVFSPGPQSGKPERFTFIVPLYSEHPDHPGTRLGLRGSVINAYVEIPDPSSTWHLEAIDFVHEPVKAGRTRDVTP